MKKIRFYLVSLFLAIGSMVTPVAAQNINVVEPDTTAADLFYIVNGDTQLEVLPFEVGPIKAHKNKFGKIASIVGNVASGVSVLGSVGMVVGAQAGSLNAVFSGIQIAGTAGNVGSLAGVAENLAGAEGHDFTYETPHAKTILKPNGKDLIFLANVKCKDRETGLGVFKVVRFNTTKKDRRLRWFQTKAALIGTDKEEDANKAGYLSFGYQSYGEHSSLLIIPANQLEKGEYGIYFLANMFEPNFAARCYTFSVE